MRNLRFEDGELVYDCDAKNCANPGAPHRVSVKEVMAGIECTFREFSLSGDPRAEALGMAALFFWQTYFGGGSDPLPTESSEWDAEFRRVLERVKRQYSPDDELDEELDLMLGKTKKKSKKRLLN